jgi:hypothetical protein
MDRNLSTNDGVMILRNSQKISSLNIDAVQARHRGNYSCYAQNKAGIAHFSAFLAVNGDLNLIFDLFSSNFAICRPQFCLKSFHLTSVKKK